MAKAKTQNEEHRANPKVEFSQLLNEHLRAGYQCMFIPTAEEARVESEIGRAAKELGMSMFTWGIDEGFSGPEDVKKRNKEFRNPSVALQTIADKDGPFKGNAIFVFRDLDDFQHDPTMRRTLRTLCEGNKLVNKHRKRPIIITSSINKLHDKVKPSIAMLDFELPGEERLRSTLEFVRASIESSDPSKAHVSEELAEKIVMCLLGLTSNEAENALARCIVRHGGFTEEMLSTIKDEKAGIIKKSEVLTYIPETQQASRSEIGGFDRLLSWVERRSRAYSKKAQAEKIDYPKGVVLIGVPGTGKSYVAAAVARLLGLPGYIMDIGSVFGSLVGESEQRMRDAIRQIEAQKGCVLLLDEADKAFAGAADNQNDSGVSRRVFGQLLTWLASKQDRTFVIMTLNRTTGIPPEFLRAGRFDAVFWTDLPKEKERREILDIHFKKRGVDPEELGLSDPEWLRIIEATHEFVGAELEQLVKESRYISFERRESGVPHLDEILEAASSIIPLAKLEKEKVGEIREWCDGRAIEVTSPPERKGKSRTRSVDIDQQ